MLNRENFEVWHTNCIGFGQLVEKIEEGMYFILRPLDV